MAFTFAIMIASPFYIIYMKQDLNFTYSTIMIVNISSSAFYLLFSKFAGKFADKYGNVKLMYISNISFVLIPILFLIVKDPIFLIFIPQLVSGIGNAAFVLSSTNFTYDSVPPQKRGEYIAYTNILVGAGGFIGSIAGGILLKLVNTTFINKFIILFSLAALIRGLVFLLYLPSIKEVKKVSHFHPMHIHLFHPFKSVQHEIGNTAKVKR